MKIHHLNAGTLRPIGGRLVLGDPTELGLVMVCHCLAIETERDGLVLVDTGIGMMDIRDPKHLGALRYFGRPACDPAEALVHQVEALGFAASDVRHIVLTHMDLDHTGGLPDFPDAAVHVHRDEWDAATQRRSLPDRSRYLPDHWAHAPTFHRYAADGEPWFGFECVRQLQGLPPELLLVPLPGHSRGHTAIAVDLGDRWLLHCGDAYFHHHESLPHRGRAPWGLRAFQSLVQVDKRQRVGNQERLRALAAAQGDGVTLMCAHDASEFLAAL
jgi:glyoxylase-like metal-dependent hydrolase (beta-lactamase superfamily II)